jgi:poly-D-alanine transfer protein DltD
MSAALVRLIKNKQIVGFYACEDSSDLFNLVDQITDPYGCEYIWIEYGGFHWPKSDAAIIFTDKHLKSDGDIYASHFDGAEMDAYLFLDVFGNDGWIAFTKNDNFLLLEDDDDAL